MSTVKKTGVVEHLRKERMLELLAAGKRLDGRNFGQYRHISIETGVIEKANGSAMVEIGPTRIVAGVKVEMGTPFPDTPDKGVIIVNSELLPISSPYAEPGPPTDVAIELARVTDRGVRESEMIDLSKMSIVEGEKVRMTFADVSIINQGGNLFDAISYGVVASLVSAKMNKVEVNSDGKVIETEEQEELPINNVPVSVTQAKIGSALIVDPTTDEESVMDTRITLTSENKGHICAGQKGLPGSFSPEEIITASETAVTIGEKIRKLILKAGKDGKAQSKKEL